VGEVGVGEGGFGVGAEFEIDFGERDVFGAGEFADKPGLPT
jgi:hypothetical protein